MTENNILYWSFCLHKRINSFVSLSFNLQVIGTASFYNFYFKLSFEWPSIRTLKVSTILGLWSKDILFLAEEEISHWRRICTVSSLKSITNLQLIILRSEQAESCLRRHLDKKTVNCFIFLQYWEESDTKLLSFCAADEFSEVKLELRAKSTVSFRLP